MQWHFEPDPPHSFPPETHLLHPKVRLISLTVSRGTHTRCLSTCRTGTYHNPRPFQWPAQIPDTKDVRPHNVSDINAEKKHSLSPHPRDVRRYPRM